MESRLSVKEFYKGRNVLIIGCSGFMGKVLVEKLLYTIPDIGRVYLLMRPKKGTPVGQRLQKMLSSPMFKRIKDEQAKPLEKLIPIQGDVLCEDLGICSEDMKMLSEEVSVVFHLAAILKMEATLKESIMMNTAGTKRALNVARKFENLASFIYVSTTFCYPDYTVLEEKFHSPPADPNDIIRICEWMDDRLLNLIKPSLLGQHPNTYTYSKRLAESLVHDAYPDIPCVIARPSIVLVLSSDSCIPRPIPGWVDSFNGPVGLLIVAGKGIIRTMHCDASLVAQVIPVDTAINAIIALTMIEASKKIRTDRIPIYNLNAGYQKPVTWGEVLTIGKQSARKNPFAWPLWYPGGDFTSNYAIHEIKRILFHMVPAYFIDFLLLIAGQKRILVRIQNRISLGLKVLQYFTTREWHFPCPNYDVIHTTLSKDDDQLYQTYTEDFDNESYLQTALEAARLYILKEDPAKIPLYRIYHNFLFVLHMLVTFLFWCFVLSLFVTRCEPARYLLSLCGPVVNLLPFLGSAVFKQSD